MPGSCKVGTAKAGTAKVGTAKVGTATVELVRRRWVEEGVERTLGRKEQLNRRQKRLEGQGEAHPVSSTGQALIALAWAEPPEGRAGWTRKLLADRLVECEVVESISPETVRQTLKETNSRPRSATGQALAERVLADPAGRECGVRVRDGGRAGSLPSPVKSTIASEVYHRQ